mmetsp:Transcript_20700/g.42454  ORF Transcript_20700/g.42454 Transcript_20700/m.42454 type:complete len:183 (-) Transcript_20700:228-776(-)
MSGASEKKAAKAHAKAAAKYRLIWMAANGFYVIGRMLPGYMGFAAALSAWGVFRWLLSFLAQWTISIFLCDAEARNATAGKNSGSDGEHYFDAFALLTAIQILAVLEFWFRGAEAVWWVSLVVPAGGAYVIYTAIGGSKLLGMLGFGGSAKPDEEEVDPELEAKRKRRQDLKMKRASAGARK